MKRPKKFGSGAAPKKMAVGGKTGGTSTQTKSGSSAAGKTLSKAPSTSSKTGSGTGSFGLPDPSKGRVSSMGGSGSGTVARAVRSLTSTDPANVARNRAAAARYAAAEAARGPRSDASSAQAQYALAQSRKAVQTAPKATPTTAPTPTMVYTPAPPGYRPGIDPEHIYYQPSAAGPTSAAAQTYPPGGLLGRLFAGQAGRTAQTVTMKKGGNVKAKPKPKGKK